MASTGNASGYSAARLRELLRERGLPSAGNKAELLLRLQEKAPDALLQEENREEHVEEHATNEESYRSMTQGADGATARELELVRRERDLLRRELELMRREAELRNRTVTPGVRSPTLSENTGNNI